MASEWETVRLGDYINSCLGKMLDKNKNQGELHPYLGNKNVRWGGFDLDNLAQMKFLDTEHEKYGLQYGDLVVCEGGEPGRCAIWKDEVPDMKIQKALHRIRPHQEFDSVYLHYWFCYAGKYELLDPYFTGTTIKHLTGKALSELPVPLPPIPEQKAIAHILGSLDDKIELNRRMNATLEGMAQALFQSWFVDFDPVLDNALAAGNPIPDELADRAAVRRQALDNGTANREAAKHFPATFQLTEEMGWIPEGWEPGSIGVIAKAIGGYAFKSKVFQDSGYPVIKIKNIVGDGTVSIEDAQCIDTEAAEKAIKYSLSDGDVLMAMTGATVGKIGIVVNGKNVAFLNQRVAKLVGRSVENINSFLYCFFKYQGNFEQIVGVAGGSAQPNISSSEIESAQFPIPNEDLLSRFANLVNPNFEKWISNNKLSKSLSKLRDTILPKLISGELRIPDAEKLAEETLA